MSRKRRPRPTREERVKPPPEAAQHHRPWPLQQLLVAGPDAGGIDADEFEAALVIVETFKALVADLEISAITPERMAMGQSAIGNGQMSDRDAELVACWFEWSAWLPMGLPARLVREIEDQEPIRSVPILRRACRSWDRIRHDHQRKKSAPNTIHGFHVPVDSAAHNMLTMPRLIASGAHPDARPANLPTQAFSPRSGVPTHLTCAAPTPSRAEPRSDAVQTRPTSPVRR